MPLSREIKRPELCSHRAALLVLMRRQVCSRSCGIPGWRDSSVPQGSPGAWLKCHSRKGLPHSLQRRAQRLRRVKMTCPEAALRPAPATAPSDAAASPPTPHLAQGSEGAQEARGANAGLLPQFCPSLWQSGRSQPQAVGSRKEIGRGG